ncbi:MAG: hypothetical protein IPH69_08835 [Bacteroidales bacterium]|nr:hypothetical protein [Bacteroidales bacterium]MBK7628277.1 hypothetical protein [Bacteroidales bacterium]
MRFSYVLFIAVIFAMTGYSCKEKGGKYIDQGEIHYNINYIGNFGVPKEYLPQNLIVSFKSDKILFEMIGFGKSGIMNLANPEKGIFDTYFSLFTKKFYYAAKSGELFPGFEAMDDMILKKTSKTKVICGFTCKNAEVTFGKDRNKIYNIWYTNEIEVKDPNAATPFNEIDGVLLGFFFLMGPSELHFEAETVYKKDIPDETFERRDDFVRVTKENINKFINQML